MSSNYAQSRAVQALRLFLRAQHAWQGLACSRVCANQNIGVSSFPAITSEELYSPQPQTNQFAIICLALQSCKQPLPSRDSSACRMLHVQL